jgi:hypothetical protein
VEISFDLLAQNGDLLVVVELISDSEHALSKIFELQGKTGQLRQYLGAAGGRMEIYALVVILREVYEKLFRRFEEARQNPVSCRKLLLSIEHEGGIPDAELKSKLEFDLLPVLPFDENEFVMRDVDGLSILAEKLKGDKLTFELVDSYQKGGSDGLQRLIESKAEGIQN